MFRSIFILAALFISLNLAQANFNGRWEGSGQNWGPGNQNNCQHVLFEFSQGFSSFDILRAEAFCGPLSFYFPTGTLTVQNGVLKDRGFAIGMIGADYMHFSYSYRPGTLNIIDIRLNAKGGMSVINTQSDAVGTREIRADLTQ